MYLKAWYIKVQKKDFKQRAITLGKVSQQHVWLKSNLICNLSSRSIIQSFSKILESVAKEKSGNLNMIDRHSLTNWGKWDRQWKLIGPSNSPRLNWTTDRNTNRTKMIHSHTFSMALANAILCFCPPDNMMPLSPTSVSNLSGKFCTKLKALAFLAASSISCWVTEVGSLAPYLMFSAIVQENNVGSWNVSRIVQLARRQQKVTSIYHVHTANNITGSG